LLAVPCLLAVLVCGCVTAGAAAWCRDAAGAPAVGNDLAYHPYWTVEVRFAGVLVSLTGEKLSATGKKR
jgi:hypothetical protein